MKREENALIYADCKFKIGEFVYVFEMFEIKRRKILSITFGDSAQTLKRTRFEEDRHIKNEKEVSYVLTTYETYHESELFKTRLELENGLLKSLLPQLCASSILEMINGNQVVRETILNLTMSENMNMIKAKIKKEEKSKILKEIYAEELPKIREEIEQKERPKIVERIIQEETAIMADKITKEIKTESYNNGWENGYAEAIKKVKNDIPSQINDLVANVFGLAS